MCKRSIVGAGLLSCELSIKLRRTDNALNPEATTLALEKPYTLIAHLRRSKHPPPSGRRAAKPVVWQPGQLRGAAAGPWGLHGA